MSLLKTSGLRAAFAAALLGLAAAPTAPVQAQGVFDMGMITSNAGLQSVEMAERKRAGMPDKYGGKSPTGSRAALGKSFAYVPTAALRQQTVNNYVAQIKALDPAAGATLAENLKPGKTDYTALYREINKGSGLKENDAADVMAAYLILNWMVTNNVQDGKAITVPMARGVRAQTASTLAKNPKFGTPATAAALGEDLKLHAAMLQVGWFRSVKDGTDADYRQKTAANFQQQYKFDISQKQLTAEGFVNK